MAPASRRSRPARQGRARSGLIAALAVVAAAVVGRAAVADSTFPLRVDVVPAGAESGTVTVTPPGATCATTCTYAEPAGAIVTLTPVPGPAVDGLKPIFNGWGGDCDGEGDCELTMDRAHAASAGFVLVPTRGRVPRQLSIRRIVAVCKGTRRLVVTVHTSFAGPASARLTRRGHSLARWNGLHVRRGTGVLRLALPRRVVPGWYGLALRVGVLPDALAAGRAVHVACGSR